MRALRSARLGHESAGKEQESAAGEEGFSREVARALAAPELEVVVTLVGGTLVAEAGVTCLEVRVGFVAGVARAQREHDARREARGCGAVEAHDGRGLERRGSPSLVPLSRRSDQPGSVAEAGDVETPTNAATSAPRRTLWRARAEASVSLTYPIRQRVAPGS